MSAGSDGMARRSLLVGGSWALGLAAAGGGAWAWLGAGDPEGGARPSDKSTTFPVPSPEPLRDYLWQVQIPPVDDQTVEVFPAAEPMPVVLGDNVMLVTEDGLTAVDPTTGDSVWTTVKLEDAWRVTTDGHRIFRIPDIDYFGVEGQIKPLVVDSVNASSGKPATPRQTFKDFNILHNQGQLICCRDDMLYLTGGTGEFERSGYATGQTWYLVAVDMRTGAERWRRRLQPHKKDTSRPHFLAGQVVGNLLVLLQETAAGKVMLAVHESRNGRPLWSSPFPDAEPDAVRGLLAVDDQHVYLGFGPLRALRLSDGKEAWNLAAGRPGASFGPPTVKDGVVYAVQAELGLVAVGAADGTVRWEEKGEAGTQADRTDPPVVGDRFVYGKGPSGLRQIDISTRTTVATYKTSGTRFIAHEHAKMIFSLGGPLIAGYRLE